jgi:integrase
MQQINGEVYIGSVSVPITAARDEYLNKYDVLNLTAASRYEASLALNRLISLTGDIPTRKLTQAHLDAFLLDHSDRVGPWTVNKTIGRLTAFLNWARHPQRRYITAQVTLQKVKTPPVTVKILTNPQIRQLIDRAPTQAWRIRLLISLTTGLRKNDTDSLRIDELDLKAMTIETNAFKTGKGKAWPLPDKLAPLLTTYIDSLPAGQEKLFTDRNIRKIWDSFRQDITRQDLRKTFSTIMQTIGSIDSARDLLQHSSDRTTSQFYTDRQFVLRWKVNQLPLDQWI